ncbi:MAG: coproporphyrinogen III oxidase [Arenicella sp.]|jgi:hypothetical protein
MLKYIKTVLEKVSFDTFLFEKELRKALDRIDWDDTPDFKSWCYARFTNLEPVLDRCFGEMYTGVLA